MKPLPLPSPPRPTPTNWASWLVCAAVICGFGLGWVEAKPKPPTPAAAPSASAPHTISHNEIETPRNWVRGLAPLPGGAPIPPRDRPPGSREGDGGPSPVIFPAQQITIRFNHQKHVKELGLACVSCHQAALTSRHVRDQLLPAATQCDSCHGTNHEDLSEVKGEAEGWLSQCGFCHIGYQPEDGNQVAKMRMPTANLRFNHQIHAERNIGCPQCHGMVENIELATREQLPRMQGCLRCHQAPEPTRGLAKGECSTCHLTESSGVQIRTEFLSGQLKPPSWLHNSEHGPDWIERHKYIAGADSQACSSCHTEKYCVDCHDGTTRPRRIHPNDFLSMHAAAAAQNSPRCTSCHQQQSFCVGCHQRSGVTLSGPYGNFSGRGRFHPPKSEWTDLPRSASHHAFQAQRNLNACVSCHQERDCLVCHSSASRVGSSLGASASNPHPPNFRQHCASALRRNARPCLTCHDPTDPQLRECR